MGMTHELQQAYLRSQREVEIPNEQQAMQAHLDAGKSVLMHSYVVGCPSTDAILGSALKVVEVFDTPEAADAKYAEMGGDEASDSDDAYFVKHPQRDYTRDRHQILAGVTLETLAAELGIPF